MQKKEIAEKARKRVKEKKSFYAHFNAFCIVSFLLFVINYFTSPGIWWFIPSIAGWAMAVLGHYLRVFGVPSLRNEQWEEAQLETEMRKLEKEQSTSLDLDESNEGLELKDPIELRRNYDEDDLV